MANAAAKAAGDEQASRGTNTEILSFAQNDERVNGECCE
jgi:hypothetical protein